MTSILVLIAGCASPTETTLDAAPGEPQVDAAVSSDASPASPTIPIAMQTLPNGISVPTVQVAIGGGAPFTVLLDTGSVGLRVLPGAVAEDWHVGTTMSSTTYGSGVIASGVVATAIISIGGVKTTREIVVEDITSVTCTANRPNCPAAGLAPSTFRFAGTFRAILGIGMRAQAATGMASPLAAMGTRSAYVLSLPAFGGAAGAITIDPDPTTVARFVGSRVQLAASGAVLPDGIGAWDDTKVPFCINACCSYALLDTGQSTMSVPITDPADFTKLGVPNGTTTVPAGTSIQLTIAGNQTWTFQVGSPPRAGKDLIKLDGSVGAGIKNLGITPYHQLDFSYDYSAGLIGLAPKVP